MSSLHMEEFYATDVDNAREMLLGYHLHKNLGKVIYFDGWDGFGASAILRSIAQVLPYTRTTPKLCFDRAIFIDCSNWKNRRTMQRTIAEELELDRSVMSILDKYDQDDDYNGVDERSRNEVDSVGKAIDQTLMGIKLMMIFLNGSDDEIDVGLLGIPRFATFGNNMMIWTFRRSLTMSHDNSEVVSKLKYTHGFIYYNYKIIELEKRHIWSLMHQEAASLVARVPCMLDFDQKMVADCCLYELFLKHNFHITTKLDWATHRTTYWICDGIIQDDRARDVITALHQEINWNSDAPFLKKMIQKFMGHPELPFLVIKDDDVYEEGAYRWISIKSRNTEVCGMQTIPSTTTTFFLAFERFDNPQTLPNGMFEHSSNLRVLVLYWCAFSFASPPFLKCRGLRFLGLDHCTDEEGIGEDHIEWLCLYSLRVLDLRYTNWNEILSQEKMDLMTNIRELNIEGVMGWQYIANLQWLLPKLQRLRIIKPTWQWEASEEIDRSFMDKTSMEILDLSNNCGMEVLSTSLSKSCSLRLLVLDGCHGLECIDGLPPSLESFSFNGYGPASQWTETVELPSKSTITDNEDARISKISLAGCTQLENMFLCWLPNLVELDLSETAIKILDLNTMVVQVPRLKRLFLLGCKHLRAIIWSHESDLKVKHDLELLCIDTRTGMMCPRPSINKNNSFRLQVHAVVVDARLARSLFRLLKLGYREGDVHFNVHVTSSHTYDEIVQFEATGKYKIAPSDQGILQLNPAGRYSDVLGIVVDPPMQAFPQPPTTKSDRHVEIAQGSFYLEKEVGNGDGLGSLMKHNAESLHVHDVSLRATGGASLLSSYYDWGLRWCRIERCPKLDADIFLNPADFSRLETFWASDLLMARCIWRLTIGGIWNQGFNNLRHLQLRSCPSLQVVFAVEEWLPYFGSLETLHIIHCGELSHIFTTKAPVRPSSFPKLTTIHLHDLPKLQNICNLKVVAPALESIKIRGCWSLRRLPSVGARGQGKKKPTVEIEKDVWDALEWDADHRPDHFEAPVHSRYYKKKLPTVSVLR